MCGTVYLANETADKNIDVNKDDFIYIRNILLISCRVLHGKHLWTKLCCEAVLFYAQYHINSQVVVVAVAPC